MSAFSRFVTVLHLTLHEAARRRVLLASALGALAFLALYATGFHFVAKELGREGPAMAVQNRLVLNFFTLAGLYAANFLTVLSAVLLPIDTLSGEIASGVMQTLAAKPVRRAEIVLGKWFGYWLVTAAYLLLVDGGVLLVARIGGHFTPPHAVQGLALLLLEATCLVSLSIAGGARLSTVTNGVVAFALFGLAFIGGWIEQVAAMLHNNAARDVGTVASLLVPTEAMWQRAAYLMQPAVMTQMHATPFSPASVPSPLMVGWAAGWALLMVVLAVRGFARRGL